MKNVIIMGLGEVGGSLLTIEKNAGHDVDIITIGKLTASKEKEYDVMHVCIPFSKDFISNVNETILTYKPKLVIINSTVPVGTTKKLHDMVSCYIVHSPIRGVHPDLVEGIMTFEKYVGGDEDSSDEAIKHFEDLLIRPYYLGNSDTTEMAKIMSTTYYGWNILFAKMVEDICINEDLDFNKVYTHPNRTYNDGYGELGMEHVIRPVLYPCRGVIGGHCITPNVELLPDSLLKRAFKQLNLK